MRKDSTLQKNAQSVSKAMNGMVKSFLKNKKEFEREWDRTTISSSSFPKSRRTHGSL